MKSDWGNGHGDWLPRPKSFPTAWKRRRRRSACAGLIPGLWFEMETVGDGLGGVLTRPTICSKRDGLPLTVASAAFGT